ncbi:MAG: fibronectin type III domain-containing protein, partial [Proteobacteria bacterium]|nr:fibronectin type III domain-containing protein [Pseudomonadota bacterium]
GYANPNYTYQWSDASGAITGATSPTYSTTLSGSYSLTITTPIGCSATSNTISTTVIIPTAPVVLPTTAIGLNEATMNWVVVSNMDHYDIRLRPQGSTSWSILINNIQGTSKTKIGLSSSTTYEWQIRSACSIDSSSVSSWSSMQSFTTITPCITPVNATELGVGFTAATLTWDAVVGSWGYIVRYKETYQPFGAMVYDTVHTNSYALSGLSIGTSYQWQVRSICDSTGSNSSSFNFTNFF